MLFLRKLCIEFVSEITNVCVSTVCFQPRWQHVRGRQQKSDTRLQHQNRQKTGPERPP